MAKITKKINTKENLSYKGEVTIKLCDGDNVIETKKFKNAGTKYLARFLCLCIAGNYSSADNTRPFKVKLYFNKTENASDASNNLQNSTACMGSFMSIDKLPAMEEILNQNQDKIIGYSVTLHFLIPYTYIQVDGDDWPNQICLYGMDIKNSIDNDKYIASVLLREWDSALIPEGYKWKPVEVPATSRNNYNLIVEWTMKFELDRDAEADYRESID